MEENFGKWKELNKEFCLKANEHQIQTLYLTQFVISELQQFALKQLKFNELASEIYINKVVNKLAKIRTLIATQNKKLP